MAERWQRCSLKACGSAPPSTARSYICTSSRWQTIMACSVAHSRFSALVYPEFWSGGPETTVLQTIRTIAAGIGTMWGGIGDCAVAWRGRSKPAITARVSLVGIVVSLQLESPQHLL